MLKLLVGAFLCVVVVCGEEVCQTFAGGAVYPRDTGKSSGHSLQWTKAMSILVVHRFILPGVC